MENSQRQQLLNAYGFFSQSFFELPAGAVEAVYGLEYRYESFMDTPDPRVQKGIASIFPAQPTQGIYDVKEGYAEVKLPLLRQQPLADALELSLAGRYSKHSLFRGDSNTKLGLRWKPYADLLLRGRTPALSARRRSQNFSWAGISTPCSLAPIPAIPANPRARP